MKMTDQKTKKRTMYQIWAIDEKGESLQGLPFIRFEKAMERIQKLYEDQEMWNEVWGTERRTVFEVREIAR